MIFSLLCQCFDVSRELLLLSGDIELNPGLTTRAQECTGDTEQTQLDQIFTMLQRVNDCTEKMEKGQGSLIESVNAVQKNQEAIQASLKDIDKRLSDVESKASGIDDLQQELSHLRQLTDNLCKENARLIDDQSELEDRMRRENLLFYGLQDEPLEKWEDTENKVLNLISETLKLPVSKDMIQRAHRIGVFSDDKERPVVVKFSSFKLKQMVLLSSAKLKNESVSISEDYSFATRQARKKLVEFGKMSKCAFKLRYKTLHMNDKCYGYSHTDKKVYEHLSRNAQSTSTFKPDNETGSSAALEER